MFRKNIVFDLNLQKSINSEKSFLVSILLIVLILFIVPHITDEQKPADVPEITIDIVGPDMQPVSTTPAAVSVTPLGGLIFYL